MVTYPVDAILSDVQQAFLSSAPIIVQAPPGAGKTTRVPPALLDVLPKGRIVMLEPRRIAAVSAARWMARLRGEEVGQTIGYTIRFERKVSSATRIEVVTEGVLTRRIQADPALEGVAAVVFDEFHERSIHADLGLALCLDARKGLREDLKVLVMSATLDSGPVEALFGSPRVFTSGGRMFPVEERYAPERKDVPLADQVVAAVRQALAETEGDVLVFLPGAGEIWRCAEGLRQALAHIGGLSLHPLYGDLPFAEQEQAILPSDRRKVVLATNIAETSLTIEGVRVVIDSGLTRRLQHDPSTGMNRLVTVPVSRASAEQRKGRAGRLGPGVCYRLYSRHTFQLLAPHSPPEILVSDLSSLVLELAVWGVRDPSSLSWLDLPPAAAWDSAKSLLHDLGALDRDGAATPAGREMARLPVHPRVGRLLLRAVDLGCLRLGADLASMLSERDLLRRSGETGLRPEREPDVDLRLEHLRSWRRGDRKGGVDADPWGLRTIERASRQIAGLFRDETGRQGLCDHGTAGRLLLSAYPDRLGMQRHEGRGRFLLTGGKEVRVSPSSLLSGSPFIVAPKVDLGRKGAGVVHLAAAVTDHAIRDELPDRIGTTRRVEWSAKEGRVVAISEEKLGAIVLSSRPFAASDEEAAPLLFHAVRTTPGLLTFGREARQFQARVALVRRLFPGEEWPDLSEDSLLAEPERWLAPFLDGLRSAQDLSRLDVLTALKGMLSRRQSRLLDERAPGHLTVPSGRGVLLDYASGELPVLAVKLQEMFGLADTPVIAGGRAKVLIHLLSPAGRPVQVTQDLRSFWNSGYQQVRRELKGRYPKHPWPDDPWNAVPKRGTKRQGC